MLSGAHSRSNLFLSLTLILGLAFVFYQFNGFNQLIEAGLYTTGPESNVASSFLYVITGAHLLHIFAGIIVLIRVLYRNINMRYTREDHLGFTLGSIFWHFVDALWIYLFLFFYFIR